MLNGKLLKIKREMRTKNAQFIHDLLLKNKMREEDIKHALVILKFEIDRNKAYLEMGKRNKKRKLK